MGLLGEAVGQRHVADLIDETRVAAGQAMDDSTGQICHERDGTSGHGDSMADVLRRFLFPERFEMVVDGNALGQLDQFTALQQYAQCRLSGQNDLERLPAPVVQIRQQSKLFQHRGPQILRFVDHQHDATMARMFLGEKSGKAAIQFDAVQPLPVQPEGHQNPGQEATEPGMRMRQDAERHFPFGPVENRIQKSRLTRSRLTRNHRKGRAIEQTIFQQPERHLVFAAEVQEPRVRDQRKRVGP